MNIRHLLIAVLLLSSTLVAAQSSAVAAANTTFAGTWEASANDLPAIQITIQQTSEDVEGAAVFYFQSLGPDKQWHVAAENPAVPLLAPKVEGKVLSFEVQHYKCHGCPELGPNVRFVMKVTEANGTLLYRMGDDLKANSSSGPGWKLTRTETHTAVGPTMQKGITVELPATR